MQTAGVAGFAIRRVDNLNVIRLCNWCINDFDAMLRIENEVKAFAWKRSQLLSSIEQAERGRVIVGSELAGMRQFRGLDYDADAVVAYSISKHIEDELHLLNIAVKKSLQGKGLGHLLMQDLVDFAGLNRIRAILLEVRANDSVARSFYDRWQFEAIAIRKNYYKRPGMKADDACVMAKKLSHPTN